jgi:hypothetical protein
MKKGFSIQQVTIIVLFTLTFGCLMGVVAMKIAAIGQPDAAEGAPVAQCPATHTPTMPAPTFTVTPEPTSTLPVATPVAALPDPTATLSPTALLPTPVEPTASPADLPPLPQARTATPASSSPITLTLTAEQVTSLAQEEAAQADPGQVTIRDPVVNITEQNLELTGQVTNLGFLGSGNLKVVGVPVVEDDELRFRVTRASVNGIGLPQSLLPDIEDAVNRVLARSLLGYDAQEVALSQGLITLTVLPWSP